MSTPLLYDKVTPNIKKPILALCIFISGFILFSFAIIWQYHNGIIVPKKESILAISSFSILFIIYTLLTYDADTGFKFPYFIQKYLIDPKLRADLERSQPQYMRHAYILDIQASSKSTYALLLQSPELVEPEWFQVNLNLMFPKLYFFQPIEMQNSCLGQDIDIEYLAESKIILNLCASEIETDFSMLKNTPFFCAIPKTLARIPSQFLLDFHTIQNITVEHHPAQTDSYQMICKTPKKTYLIPSNIKGFEQLEIALSNKINWTTYNAFKQQQALNKDNISCSSIKKHLN